MNTITFCVAGLMTMLSGLILGSCQASNGLEENINTLPLGEDVAIVAGTSYKFAEKDNKAAGKLIVRIQNIAESRCPTGLNCITAGNVAVQFLVMSDSTDAQTVDMCLGDCETPSQGRRFVETDSAEVRVASKGYTIILREVNPYPTADNVQPENQEVVLRIELVK